MFFFVLEEIYICVGGEDFLNTGNNYCDQIKFKPSHLFLFFLLMLVIDQKRICDPRTLNKIPTHVHGTKIRPLFLQQLEPQTETQPQIYSASKTKMLK